MLVVCRPNNCLAERCSPYRATNRAYPAACLWYFAQIQFNGWTHYAQNDRQHAEGCKRYLQKKFFLYNFKKQKVRYNMKKVILALCIAFFSLNAQMQEGMMGQMMQKGTMPEGMMPGMSMMQEMGMMHGYMCINHISRIFSSAEDIASDDIKSKVLSLKKPTLEKLIRQEAEVRIARMNLHMSLMDPSAKDKDIEKELKNLNEQENKLKEIAISSLISLRKLIGAEKFVPIFKKGQMGMMQMPGSSGEHNESEDIEE